MVNVPNLLLANLPQKNYRELLPGLAPSTLAFGQVLYEPDGRVEHVYFPGSSLVSLLTVTDRHLALEVGMVGREGLVGVSLALGVAKSPVRALVQGGGAALRMSSGRFSSALRRSPALRDGVHGYIHRLMNQISRTAACNRFHVVEARLARWLLMTRDRLGRDEFRMTHEFLAAMLGVRRVGVTEAASALQQRKLIEYSRGRIRVLNLAGLQAASCSCYVRLTG
jgi:CRP-like cAMP-binding protein